MRHLRYKLLPAVLLLAAALMLVAAEPAPTTHPAPPPAVPTQDVEFQVVSLKTLLELELTPEQLKSLQSLAANTGGKPASTAEAKGSDAYKKALTAYHDALAAGDEEKISDAQNKVDELRETEEIEPDTAVELTDAARAAAPAAVKLLTPSQIAAYIAVHAHEVPSPLEAITDALDQAHGKSPAELAKLQKEGGDLVALLVAGVAPEAAKPVAKKVSDLIAEAAKMSEEDFKAKRRTLEESAKKIVAASDSMENLRHWMEGELADLLSNPETKAILAAKVK